MRRSRLTISVVFLITFSTIVGAEFRHLAHGIPEAVVLCVAVVAIFGFVISNLVATRRDDGDEQ